MGSSLLVAHVLKVAVHDGDGVHISVSAKIGDGEILRGYNTHVDDVRVGLIGSVGIGCRVVLELTVVFNDGDVVIVAWVGHLARGVVKTFAAQQEDVVVGTGAGKTALGFTVITDFKRAIRVGLS